MTKWDGKTTPSVAEFLALERDDPRLWWKIGCGHHENLFQDAVQQLSVAKAEVERLKWFLESSGYRRCDAPACNCGSYHGGNASARLTEIYEELGGCNGTTALRECEHLKRVEQAAREYVDNRDKRSLELYTKLVKALAERGG